MNRLRPRQHNLVMSLAGIALVAALAVCWDSTRSAKAGIPPSTVVVRMIPPEATGQNIRRVNGDHLVAIDLAKQSNGLL